MLRRLVILLTLCIPQLGCDAEYGEGFYPYEPVEVSPDAREFLASRKRDFLTIEEINIGEGPLAALGRKITADLDVRYEDGSVAYQGDIIAWYRFLGSPGIHNSSRDNRILSFKQPGIRLGLNGMAVGCKRRIIIESRLVCGDGKSEPNPTGTCSLTRSAGVHKVKLIVEAVLLESCLPVSFRSRKIGWGYAMDIIIGCRNLYDPRSDPSAPI